MILSGKHYILYKEKHTLLPQGTFEALLNRTHKEEYCKQGQRTTAVLTNTAVKNSLTIITTHGLGRNGRRTGSKGRGKKSARNISTQRFI